MIDPNQFAIYAVYVSSGIFGIIIFLFAIWQIKRSIWRNKMLNKLRKGQ